MLALPSVAIVLVVVGGRVKAAGVGVGVGVMSEVVQQYLFRCHLVLVDAAGGSPDFTNILRGVEGVSQGGVVVVVEAGTTPPDPQLVRHLQEGEARFTCRVIILDLTAATTVNKAVMLLKALQVEVWPTTRVVALGPSLLARPLLDDPSLANTVHTLYLAHNHPASTTEPSGSTSNTTAAEVLAYSRCHYCYEGDAKVVVLDRWSLSNGGFHNGANLFPDQFKDCMGHKFRVVSMDWFPFLKFRRDSQAPATTVTPLDSLDVRMLDSIARVLNFTYEIRIPWDNQWGVRQDNGNWTGTVGTLQHQQADFSMLLNWSQERKNIIDFSRIYAAEPLVMVTSKPRPLPQYLSIVNPFTSGVWLGVVMMGVCGGLVYWVLQWARRHLPGDQDLSCGSALFYTTGLLLEDPPFKLPTNMTGQVFVGWWCVFGMLLASMYRCSLVAHLSVPGRAAPVETFAQLLAQEGWSWGLEPTYGAEWEWFQSSTTTTVRNIFHGIQILDLESHLAQILDQGHHALLTWKYHIQTVVASRYTDSRGYTPLYIGRAEYYVSTGYGWGFRKGAPFLPHLDKTKQRLVETGHINHWLNDLIQTSARTARKEEAEKKHLQEKEQSQELEVAGARTVLSVEHLQGAFLLLSLGYIAAFFTLLGEAALVALTLWKCSPSEPWTCEESC